MPAGSLSASSSCVSVRGFRVRPEVTNFVGFPGDPALTAFVVSGCENGGTSRWRVGVPDKYSRVWVVEHKVTAFLSVSQLTMAAAWSK